MATGTVSNQKLTKSFVAGLELTKGEQRFVWDVELKGFGVRINGSTKAYIVQREVGGRTVRLTLGRTNVLAPDEARNAARDAIAKMARGEDPRRRDTGPLTPLRHGHTTR